MRQASSVLPNIIRPSIALDAASILFVVTSVSKSGVAVTHDVQPAVAAAAAMIHDEKSEAIVPTTIVRRSSLVSLINMSQDFLAAFSCHAMPSTAAPTSTDHGVVKHIWRSIYFPMQVKRFHAPRNSIVSSKCSIKFVIWSSLVCDQNASEGVRVWAEISSYHSRQDEFCIYLHHVLKRCPGLSQYKSWTSCCHPQFSS